MCPMRRRIHVSYEDTGLSPMKMQDLSLSLLSLPLSLSPCI